MQQLLNKYLDTRPFASSKTRQNNQQELTPELLEIQLESDRGRIINSAAVRRLQQKTQVFPLERNAAVRSRLTHSLEVQQTGRFITRTVFKLLRLQGQELSQASERATESLVEMACLMHDIGNPPFGHFGEETISRWFSQQLPLLPTFQQPLATPQEEQLKEELLRELATFEGNAQALRIIFNLQRLNLTYLQTACVLKYTRCATQPRPANSQPLSYLQKKPGYYFSESQQVAKTWQTLNLQPNSRFALSYLMEAADDISYCLADLEDSVDKNILTFTRLTQLLEEEFNRQCAKFGLNPAANHFKGQSFQQLIEEALAAAQAETFNQEHQFFLKFRVKLVHPLVEHAAQAFINNLSQVTAGTYNAALLEDSSPCHALIATLKKVAQKHVFRVNEVNTLMLQGHKILTGLLDFYWPLLKLSQAEFNRLINKQPPKGKHLLYEVLLVDRLPAKQLDAYEELTNSAQELGAGFLNPEVWELYCRCRLLQDTLSGMTDYQAQDEYKVLAALLN